MGYFNNIKDQLRIINFISINFSTEVKYIFKQK